MRSVHHFHNGESESVGDTSKKLVKNGDISNQFSPFLAFDLDTVMYVPEKFVARAKVVENTPFLWRYAEKYYRPVPRCRQYLDNLHFLGFNIMMVFTGPRRLWEVKKKFLEKYTYTTLACVENGDDLRDEIFRPNVRTYYSVDPRKVELVSPKGKLFDDWDQLLNAKMLG